MRGRGKRVTEGCRVSGGGTEVAGAGNSTKFDRIRHFRDRI